jgi:hypothetical protein
MPLDTIKVDMRDHPHGCPHCRQFNDKKRARQCADCGKPLQPRDIGERRPVAVGFDGQFPHHVHLQMQVVEMGRTVSVEQVPPNRELCEACYLVDYERAFPGLKPW